MSNSSQEYIPQLINDNPSSEDRFGTHERIALSIYDLIHKNSGGKTVSIEGEWGSGKSTVIKLLSNEVQKNKESLVINYDAWIHSGDPLRRAFFNNIIEELYNKVWLRLPSDEELHHIKRLKQISERTKKVKKELRNEEFWSLFRDSLFGRLKHISKSTRPQVNNDSKYILTLLIYFPVAALLTVNMFRGYTMDEYFFIDWHWAIHFLFIVCALITIAPILMLVSKKLSPEKISLYLTKTITDEDIDQIEEPDLTSIEFRELFSFVMRIALLNEVNRKLIIVIDNLDRLKLEEGEHVWSLLKSFIDYSSFNSDEHTWIRQIWVIVPRAANCKAIEDNEKKKQMKGENYFEKIFQLRFSLPPPLLSSWQTYLGEILEASFGHITSQDKNNIVEIFDWHVIGGHLKEPSPRNLKIFVNELVWLFTLWKKEYDIVTLAAYLLDTKGREGSITTLLTSNKIPSRLALNIAGKQLLDAYPSIYFNVRDTRQAKGFLYIPRIEELLREGAFKELVNILQQNNHAIVYFGTVFRKLMAYACRLTPKLYFNAVLAIKAIRAEFQEQFDDVLDSAIFIAVKEIGDVDGLPLGEENSVSGIIALNDLAKGKANLVQLLIDALKRSKIEDLPHVSYSATGANVHEWIKRLILLINRIKLEDYLAREEDYSISLPLLADDWKIFCHTCESEFETFRKFRPVVSHYAINENILNIDFGNIDRSTLSWAIKLNFTEQYTKSIQLIYQKISMGDISEQQLEPILDLALENIDEKTIKNQLLKLHRAEHLYAEYYSLSRGDNVGLMAKLFILILVVDPRLDLLNPTKPASTNGYNQISEFVKKPEENDDFVEAILEIIHKNNLERLIIDLTKGSKSKNQFAHMLFERHINKPKIYDKFILNDLTSELSSFLNAISQSHWNQPVKTSVIRYLIEKKNLIEVVINQEIAANNFYYYITIIEEFGIKAESLVKKLSQYFELFNKEDWKRRTQSYSFEIRALRILPQLNLNKNATNALIESLLQNKKLDNLAGIRIFQHLSPRQKTKAIEFFWNFINEASTDFDKNTWDVFKNALFPNLSKYKQNIPSLISNLLNNEDWIGLSALADELKRNNLLDNYSNEVSNIRHKLSSLSKDADQDSLKVINKFKRLIRRQVKN